ncbi:hypothetical protein Tco_0968080 [Tanacetum coccineum]
MIDEEGKSDTESDDITKAEKKFKMLAKDEEVARKVQEEWEAEEEKKRLAEEEATKHVGGKKHSDLKTKTFEEIQVLYERLKRQDQNFVAIRSAKDERQIKELNKDLKKKRVIKETLREKDTAKVPAEQEVTEQGIKKRKSGHVKMLARKRTRPQLDDGSDDEHIKCLRIITFKSTIDSEIWRQNLLLLGCTRHEIFHLYDLVMKQYSKITPEDIELILWGDLKIMMESSREENDQDLKDGTVIYMIIERKYPLSKELLQQMLDLGL